MWKEALLDFLSKHPGTACSDAMLRSTLPSDLAIYSVKSNSEKEQTIFALVDCYVDELADDSADLAAGSLVFRLNAFQHDRDRFKLQQQKAMTGIAAGRLEEDYISRLVVSPLTAGLEAARALERLGERQLQATLARFDAGEVTKTDVAQAQMFVEESRANRARAEVDLEQRKREIEFQRKRLAAENADIDKRIDLTNKIVAIHTYEMPSRGRVTAHTYRTAFVEEGDPICTIRI